MVFQSHRGQVRRERGGSGHGLRNRELRQVRLDQIKFILGEFEPRAGSNVRGVDAEKWAAGLRHYICIRRALEKQVVIILRRQLGTAK